MSLETVVEDIRDEARERAEEIRADTEQQAEEILDDARGDADEIREQKEQEVENRIEQEREQRLSSAKLEAKQKRLETRRDVLEEVRDEVETALLNLDDETREELTRELLEAATDEFEEAESVSVYGRETDEALIESILEEYDGYTYAGSYDCLGGVVVESEGSRIRVNNTFDSILDEVWEDNLQDISNRLFDAQ